MKEEQKAELRKTATIVLSNPHTAFVPTISVEAMDVIAILNENELLMSHVKRLQGELHTSEVWRSALDGKIKQMSERASNDHQ